MDSLSAFILGSIPSYLATSNDLADQTRASDYHTVPDAYSNNHICLALGG